jgi:predicted ABC-type transport system involved in lysophospholipase L1 biosynthesis ATPase subunit
MATANQIDAPEANSAIGAVIRVEELHKYYELGEARVHALRGVSLGIHRGEFVAVMGASGSGKSTFMNILGCLDKPTSGQYLLEGTDVSRHDKKALALIRNQKIGFVFQGFNLLARTTALENTELPTLYTKIDRAERDKRATEALTMVGLAERMHHFPSQMSGGQAAGGHRARPGEPSVDSARGRADRKPGQPHVCRNHGNLSEPERQRIDDRTRDSRTGHCAFCETHAHLPRRKDSERHTCRRPAARRGSAQIDANLDD